jgi:hypothetical protein
MCFFFFFYFLFVCLLLEQFLSWYSNNNLPLPIVGIWLQYLHLLLVVVVVNDSVVKVDVIIDFVNVFVVL